MNKFLYKFFTTILLSIVLASSVSATVMYQGYSFTLKNSLDKTAISTTLDNIAKFDGQSTTRLMVSRMRSIVTRNVLTQKFKEAVLTRYYYKLASTPKTATNYASTVDQLGLLYWQLFTTTSPTEPAPSQNQTPAPVDQQVQKPVQTTVATTPPQTQTQTPTQPVVTTPPPAPTQTASNSAIVTICNTGCNYNTVTSSLNSIITTILDQKMSGTPLTLLVKAGTYQLDGGITINRDNISLVGDGKYTTKIIGKSGIDIISWSGQNGLLEGLAIDAMTTGARTAFSSGVGNMHIKNCTFQGGSNTFVVFFGGLPHADGVPYTDGRSAYQLYVGDLLNPGIIIEGSDIYSNYGGDTVVIALTQGAYVFNNTIEGKLSYYMSKNGYIQNNTFQNTRSDALFISGPSANVTVSGNTFRQIGGSAVVVRNELEHPLPGGMTSNNINFSQNTIESTTYFGMSITELYQARVSGNTIRNTGAAGIYVVGNNQKNTNNIFITSNTIENPRGISDSAYNRVWGAGIGIENTDAVTISSNTISDTAGRMLYGVYTHDANTNLSTNGNTINNAGIAAYY